MAENVKEVTQTPPLPQLNTDDNRRRTRSQTRNGGITPPAPVLESRGRKRASQSQPGSAGKRGRKPAQPAEQTETVAFEAPQASSKTEEHSKLTENQDLSKQTPKEVSEKPADKTDDQRSAEDVHMEVTEEEVKKPEADEKDKDNNSDPKREAQQQIEQPVEVAISKEESSVEKADKVEPMQEEAVKPASEASKTDASAQLEATNVQKQEEEPKQQQQKEDEQVGKETSKSDGAPEESTIVQETNNADCVVEPNAPEETPQEEKAPVVEVAKSQDVNDVESKDGIKSESVVASKGDDVNVAAKEQQKHDDPKDVKSSGEIKSSEDSANKDATATKTSGTVTSCS